MPILSLIFGFVTRNISIFRYASIALATAGAFLFIRHSGVTAEQLRQDKIAIRGVKTNEKVNDDVMSLSDSELDARLHKWIRD